MLRHLNSILFTGLLSAQLALSAENPCQTAYNTAMAACNATLNQGAAAADTALTGQLNAATAAYAAVQAQTTAIENAAKGANAAAYQAQLGVNNGDFAANIQVAEANLILLIDACAELHPNDAVAFISCACQAQATHANIIGAFTDSKTISDERALHLQAKADRLASRIHTKADWEAFAIHERDRKTAHANAAKTLATLNAA